MTTELYYHYRKWIGLSTDLKPEYDSERAISILPGEEYYETDTYNTYVWDGATWQKKNDQSVRLIDTHGDSQGVGVVSGVIPVSGPITDTEIRIHFQDFGDILGNILKELKIMNLHMSLLTDTIINKQEVE